MIKYVAEINDAIERGATFYREIVLTEPADPTKPYHPVTNSQIVPQTGKIPRSTLMNAKTGAHVASFPCSFLAATGLDPTAEGYKPARIAWTMPRDTTATLDPKTAYIHNIDYDDIDGVTSERKAKGAITVYQGQVPA